MMRSYKKPVQSKENKTLLVCPVIGCNRKYKKEEKLKTHVETIHYYETRPARSLFYFTKEQKIKIYTLSKDYAKLLYEFSKYPSFSLTEELKQSSINLLPQYWGLEVSIEELERMCAAQAEFSKKLFSLNLSFCDWGKVLEDLEHFFALGLPYYDTNFCPSLFIDFLWHSCMQDQVFYREICMNAVGELIHHCIKREEDLENERFQYFVEVFRRKYGRSPYNPTAEEGQNNNPPLETLIDGLDKQIRAMEKREMEIEEVKKQRLAIVQIIEKEIGGSVNSYEENDYITIYNRGYRGKDIRKIYIEQLRLLDSMKTSGSC